MIKNYLIWDRNNENYNKNKQADLLLEKNNMKKMPGRLLV